MLDHIEKALIKYVEEGGKDPKQLKRFLSAAYGVGETEGKFSERRWNNWDGRTAAK